MTASQLRTGMAIRFENQTYKVLAADYQPGQGKMGGVMHARLKNLGTGTTWEHGFRAELKLEEVPVEKRPSDFLYKDGDEYVFMDPETFEQFPIGAAMLGDQARLLVPDMRVTVESVDARPVAVIFPDVLELKISRTDPAIHGAVDSTWKPAELENGLQIMVPQFVKTGDMIRLSTADLKYMDRARTATK
jgi:elongation factor P